MTGTGTSTSGTSRAQSNPIAIVLVFGLVIASTTIIVVAGGSAISSTQNQLSAQNAETKMTQLDSQMATVALGSSASQEVALGTSTNYKVNGSAGQINITFSNSSTEMHLLDTSLGTVTFEGEGGNRVAYQGGGVWRGGEGDGSVMVSPPEFHYRGGTLTLPLITINNNDSFNGDAVITRNNTTPIYPNETMENPLTDGKVVINITSKYHEGWESYLSSRTEVTVTDPDPGDNTITVTLTVPVSVTFDNTAAATASGSSALETNGGGSFDSPTATGVDAASADDLVQSKIDQCKANPSDCDSLSGSTIGPGTYFTGSNTDVTLGDVDFDTNGEDINVVVDGDLDFGSNDINIEDGGTVTFYVKGGGGDGIDATGGTRINEPGDAEDLLVIAHSDVADSDNGNPNDADILIRGGTEFTGLIYAPESDFTTRGSAVVNGAIVIHEADARGSAAVTRPAAGIDYELSYASASEINYLHVSDNSVNVTAD